jgi:hypothetical protein
MKNVKVVKNTTKRISDGFVDRFAPKAPSWRCFHNYALGTIVNMRKVLKYVVANYDNIKEKGVLVSDIGVKGATMKPISVWDGIWGGKDDFMFYYFNDSICSEKTYANVENPDDIIVIRRKTKVKRYYPAKPLDYYKNFLRDLEYELKARIEE